MNARPYQTVPTVELAARMRELNTSQQRGTFVAGPAEVVARVLEQNRAERIALGEIRAELLTRVHEAEAANAQGIGVRHGAPERWN